MANTQFWEKIRTGEARLLNLLLTLGIAISVAKNVKNACVDEKNSCNKGTVASIGTAESY